MPYIGTSPSNGVRRVHTYTATASQTTFTGASSEGVTLSYADTNYIDVFQNGVLLGNADYTSTSGTSVVLAQGASADDLIVIVVYDVFSVADTVSKTNGGTFDNGITIDEDGATVLTVDRATSDGTIVDLQKSGTSVGSIGTENGHLHVSSGDTGLKIHSGVDAVIPSNGSSSRDAAVDLGYATGGRFKNLYLSGGVYLGGTGSSNHLDDYEEGTWTPIWSGSGSPTYGLQVGTYTKVGNVVHVSCYLYIFNKGSLTGAIQLGGLPFTSVNTNNNYTCGALWINTTVNGRDFDGDYHLQGYIGPNASLFNIQSLNGDGTVTALAGEDLNNTTDIMINVSYRI